MYGITNTFSRFYLRIILLACLHGAMVTSSLKASQANASSGGASVQVSWSWSTDQTVHFSATIVGHNPDLHDGQGPRIYAGYAFHRTTGAGGQPTSDLHTDSRSDEPATIHGDQFQLGQGEWIYLDVYCAIVGTNAILDSNRVYFQATITPTVYHVTISIPPNTGDRSIRYDAVQDGQVVYSILKAPGDGGTIQTLDLTSPDPVVVTGYSFGYKKEGTSYIDTPNDPFHEEKVFSGGSKTPTSGTTPSDNDTFTIPPIDVPPVAGSGVGKPPSSIWDSSTDGTNPSGGTQTDLLTNKTFRQGVDATNTKLDKIVNSNSDALAQSKKKSDDLTGAFESQKSSENLRVSAELSSRKAAGESMMATALIGRSHDTPEISIPESDQLTVEVIDGKTLNLNAIHDEHIPSWMAALVAVVKSLVGWGVVLGLMTYAYHEIRKSIEAVFQTMPQPSFSIESNSRAITVGGFSVGVIATVPLRIGLMAILAAALVAMPATVVQCFSTQWHTLAQTFMAGAKSYGAAAPMVAMVDDYFPWATMITAGVTYSLFEFVLLPIQGAWQFMARMSAL